MTVKTTSTFELVAMAKARAAADTQHAYTKVADFEPHDWVWLAMRDAYNAAQADAKPAQPVEAADGLAATTFICHLIDNHEGEKVTEESLQSWLGEALVHLRPTGEQAGEVDAGLLDAGQSFIAAYIKKYGRPITGSGNFVSVRGNAPMYAEARNLNEALFKATPNQPRPMVGEVADKADRMLSELVDKIVPGLDTGDLLADAMTASRALDAAPQGEQGGWRSMDTCPKNDGYAFLVLLPGNDVCDSLALQVSNFEGAIYADCRDGIIDWEDRIIDAAYWMPLTAAPEVPRG